MRDAILEHATPGALLRLVHRPFNGCLDGTGCPPSIHAGMGNFTLNPASFPRNDVRAPPATQVPPMFAEMRQCAVCKLCVELRAGANHYRPDGRHLRLAGHLVALRLKMPSP